VQLEYQWLGVSPANPLLVFLYEGLGSLSMWKDFPQRACALLALKTSMVLFAIFTGSSATMGNTKLLS
jgi:hypothetical protein